MRLFSFFIFLQFTFLNVSGQIITKFGNDTLIDVACWNIEWFGNTSNGPSNELLQYDNVKRILDETDIDVWGLCEVSSNTTYMDLIDDLGIYGEILASYSQTQKTALLWKKDLFNLLSWQMVLTETQYSYDFAGRPPLEVVLTTKNKPIIDTIYFYVIHLKAISDGESYGRRKNASQFMKTFLDQQRKNKKVMVIGDWNDNVTFPTWSGATVSPFKNFVDDSLNYFFVSKQLSDQGKKSYISSNGTMIDHQMISKDLFPFYVKSSSLVLEELSTQVSGFANNTSDHYPVLAYYNFERTPSVSIGDALNNNTPLSIYPNPAHNYITIESNSEIKLVQVMDLSGKIESSQMVNNTKAIIQLNETMPSGLRILCIIDKMGNHSYHKFNLIK